MMDSNHRRRTPADLQSAPFGHSGNFPCFSPVRNWHGLFPFYPGLTSLRSTCVSRRSSFPFGEAFVLPPLVVLASAFRADGGIRTHDQLITNQLLWPTELHRQYSPFWIAKVGIKNLPRKLFVTNFPLFNSSQRTAPRRRWFTGEIGCKDRKSFG